MAHDRDLCVLAKVWDFVDMGDHEHLARNAANRAGYVDWLFLHQRPTSVKSPGSTANASISMPFTPLQFAGKSISRVDVIWRI